MEDKMVTQNDMPVLVNIKTKNVKRIDIKNEVTIKRTTKNQRSEVNSRKTNRIQRKSPKWLYFRYYWSELSQAECI